MLFVSEREQIALFRHEKLFEFSRAVFHDKSLRNEEYGVEKKDMFMYGDGCMYVPYFLRHTSDGGRI